VSLAYQANHSQYQKTPLVNPIAIKPTGCDKTVFSYAQWLPNKTGRGHFGADHGIMKPH